MIAFLIYSVVFFFFICSFSSEEIFKKNKNKTFSKEKVLSSLFLG